jgi:hypothetical protein
MAPQRSKVMNGLIDALFDLTPAVRYVAIYRHGQLSLRQRPDLSLASAPESDRYEELLVNPTILTLIRQRGEIDCGGLDYVVVRYGNFFQFISPSKAATCRWRSSRMPTPSVMLRRSCALTRCISRSLMNFGEFFFHALG